MVYKISDIQKVWPDWYNKDSELTREDQQSIWENTPLPKDNEEKIKQLTNNQSTPSISLNRSVNGTYKCEQNEKLKLSKEEIIRLLQTCTHKTAPKIVASYLEDIFSKWPSQDGHWLYIAQHWTPRAINRVIITILKQHKRGEKTINNASAYFTYLIKLRKKRKGFTDTNDGRKQQLERSPHD